MRAVLAGILLLILLVLFFFPELLANDALAAVVALAGVAGIVLSAAALHFIRKRKGDKEEQGGR